MIRIEKISITELNTDAIVNAANEELQAGGGVCGAIFRAAGYNELQDACNRIGHCNTGYAVITPGFHLKAKYVIHAVGPVWYGGGNNEPELLYGAYQNALKRAMEAGCHSIGFPLISAGIFGYPMQEAWEKAIEACADFCDENQNWEMEIVFAVLSDEILAAGKNELRQQASHLKIAERSDWKTMEMPEKNEHFTLKRDFTKEQMESLRRGNIPQQQEDKWFWYMDGNTLYAYRSWTGVCMYIITFSGDGYHKVVVNRDPEQYLCIDVHEDRNKLNKLLDWWTQPEYDYYNEWLSETVDALKKSGKLAEQLSIAGGKVDAFFFHLPSEPNGYLSNWYLSDFYVGDICFSSAEQYIMYQKCMIFGDEESAQKVLATKDTAEQQRIGRELVGYVDHVWEGLRQLVAFRGLLGKFSQNAELKQKLIDTKDAWLVECGYHDTIWACGRRLNEDERLDVQTWRGQNILGFTLMEVRAVLQAGVN